MCLAGWEFDRPGLKGHSTKYEKLASRERKFNFLLNIHPWRPGFNSQENIYNIAINAIFSVTGLDMNKRDFHIVHRHGRNSERIFAEYVSHISSKMLS